MRNFLNLDQVPSDALREMLSEAARIKSARNNAPKGTVDDERIMDGKIAALIFEKPSTRTRVSFDVGVRQLGGESMVLTGRDMQLGHGETVADTARVLSRYVDLIMIRTFDEATLYELAENATVPVINGLTDSSHPCQIMADLQTFQERVGDIKGRRVVFLGDGNNVANSYFHAAGQFGFDMVFAGPDSLHPDPRAVDFARERGSNIELTDDPRAAVEGADLVVTDTWVSMHDNESSRQRRHNILRAFQVDDALMEHAGPQAYFTHCLPAHRGEEVTSSVLDGERSMAFDAAENRLHAQKAVMRWCLEGT